MPEPLDPQTEQVDQAVTHGKPVSAETTETPLEALSSMAYVVVIGLFIFAFVFQNFEIPSPSMVNTLLVGDHVMVDRVTLAPSTSWAPFVHYRPVRHGDIIVFYKPNPESPDLVLVKRAIGLPGDRIHLQHGTVYRNGVPQEESYQLPPRDDGDAEHTYDPVRDDFPSQGPPPSSLTTESWIQEMPSHVMDGELVVPPGMVFAMGDNRTQSADSRFWGFVPQENIMGRPLFVYWSFETSEHQEEKTSWSDRIGFAFHVVIHIFDGTRWSRTGHVIR